MDKLHVRDGFRLMFQGDWQLTTETEVPASHPDGMFHHMEHPHDGRRDAWHSDEKLNKSSVMVNVAAVGHKVSSSARQKQCVSMLGILKRVPK
jgi:hypothetical protein